MASKLLLDGIRKFLEALEGYQRAAQFFRVRMHLSHLRVTDKSADPDVEIKELLDAQHAEAKARRGVGESAKQLASALEAAGYDATNVLKVAYYVAEGGGDLSREPTLAATVTAELKRLAESQRWAEAESAKHPTSDAPPPELLAVLTQQDTKLLLALWDERTLTFTSLHKRVWDSKPVQDDAITKACQRLTNKLALDWPHVATLTVKNRRVTLTRQNK